MIDALHPAAGLLCATAFGAMVFFAAVVAPTVFTRLEPETAASLIRVVFPRYYLFLAVATGLSALALAASAPIAALAVGAVAVGFVYARQVLMPRINDWRDRELAGDESAAKPFARGHRASVGLNVAQMVVLAVVLMGLLRA